MTLGRTPRKTLTGVGSLRCIEEQDISSKSGEFGQIYGRAIILTRPGKDVRTWRGRERHYRAEKWWSWSLGIGEDAYCPGNMVTSYVWAHEVILLWDAHYCRLLHVTWIKRRTDKKDLSFAVSSHSNWDRSLVGNTRADSSLDWQTRGKMEVSYISSVSQAEEVCLYSHSSLLELTIQGTRTTVCFIHCLLSLFTPPYPWPRQEGVTFHWKWTNNERSAHVEDPVLPSEPTSSWPGRGPSQYEVQKHNFLSSFQKKGRRCSVSTTCVSFKPWFLYFLPKRKKKKSGEWKRKLTPFQICYLMMSVICNGDFILVCVYVFLLSSSSSWANKQVWKSITWEGSMCSGGSAGLFEELRCLSF